MALPPVANASPHVVREATLRPVMQTRSAWLKANKDRGTLLAAAVGFRTVRVVEELEDVMVPEMIDETTDELVDEMTEVVNKNGEPTGQRVPTGRKVATGNKVPTGRQVPSGKDVPTGEKRPTGRFATELVDEPESVVTMYLCRESGVFAFDFEGDGA